MPFRLFIISFIVALTACSGHRSDVWQRMECAERMMEAHPDSALSILSDIQDASLHNDKERARHALLMSMALDKNYIDTTTFDVLQPAIDHYLKKGSPDEKMRTHYYQGRIYQNAGDRDNALKCFTNGLFISSTCSDSLLIARTLVAQAYLLYELYDFHQYTNCHLKAAEIYHNTYNETKRFDCLLNALNGAIICGEKNRTDSIFRLCEGIKIDDPILYGSLQDYRLASALKFGDNDDIADIIHQQSDNLCSDIDGYLNLTIALNNLGEHAKAKGMLSNIESAGIPYDTLKYQYVYALILESNNEYKDALSAIKVFNKRNDSINTLKLNYKTKFLENQYRDELIAQKDSQIKSRVIFICIIGITILIFNIIFLLLLLHINKVKKEASKLREKNKEAENTKLRSEKEKALLECQYLQLEKTKKILETENLYHRIEALENESECLKKLLESKSELPYEVQEVIKERMEMLNSLLASHITDNDKYKIPYNEWIKNVTSDIVRFMDTNRMAFQASHPRFIQYLEEQGLDIEEINYACLYAIGLRGKEVGNYMKKRSHVNTSSSIRKKLGLDKYDTNIGIYLRKILKDL